MRGAAADEAGGGGLRIEGADADERQADDHGGEMRQHEQRQADAGQRQRHAEAARGAEACNAAAGQRRRDHRRREDEIDQAERHRRQRDRRCAQHEVDVGEGADEGEQQQEADGEAGAQRGLAQVIAQRGERRRSVHCRHRHGHRRPQREPGERGAGQIQRSEDLEVGGQAEVVCHRGREQAAEQVARHIAGDVGRERAGRRGLAAMLRQVRQC